MKTRVLETHTSTLFFVDDLVHKRKKPLDLGFSDFRELAARRHACEEEVRLNRRLAPDVYLGVATVLGCSGEPAESLVVMRRLPEGRRLSVVVGTREGEAALEPVAAQLAGLHARSPVTPDLVVHATTDALSRLWTDGLELLAQWPKAVPPHLVERLRQLASDWLQAHGALLEDRAARGRVVEGHGDVLADDVFVLDDGVRVLDCLEFDQGLRVVDGLHDACSLAADLLRLGHEREARVFLRSYRALADDDAPVSLEHFYIAYRALVRAKVACLRAGQGDSDALTEALLLAVITRDHLEAASPRLVLVGGLPGSGKSTVASGLAEALDAELLSSDRTRRLVPAGGSYSRADRSAVYDELARRARDALRLGRHVVVDATFGQELWRRELRDLGNELHATLSELECVVPGHVADARLRERGSDGESDATPLVRAVLAEQRDSWPEARVLDCRDEPRATVAHALASL